MGCCLSCFAPTSPHRETVDTSDQLNLTELLTRLPLDPTDPDIELTGSQRRELMAILNESAAFSEDDIRNANLQRFPPIIKGYRSPVPSIPSTTAHRKPVVENDITEINLKEPINSGFDIPLGTLNPEEVVPICKVSTYLNEEKKKITVLKISKPRLVKSHALSEEKNVILKIRKTKDIATDTEDEGDDEEEFDSNANFFPSTTHPSVSAEANNFQEIENDSKMSLTPPPSPSLASRHKAKRRKKIISKSERAKQQIAYCQKLAVPRKPLLEALLKEQYPQNGPIKSYRSKKRKKTIVDSAYESLVTILRPQHLTSNSVYPCSINDGGKNRKTNIAIKPNKKLKSSKKKSRDEYYESYMFPIESNNNPSQPEVKFNNQILIRAITPIVPGSNATETTPSHYTPKSKKPVQKEDISPNSDSSQEEIIFLHKHGKK